MMCITYGELSMDVYVALLGYKYGKHFCLAHANQYLTRSEVLKAVMTMIYS